MKETSFKLFKNYALTGQVAPTFAHLAAQIQIPEKATTAPQNACKSVHPDPNKTTAIGLPTRRPAEIGTNSMPIRTPITDSDGDRVTATVGGRETKVPEKKLCGKVSFAAYVLKLGEEVVGRIPVEDAEHDHAGSAPDVDPDECKQGGEQTARREHVHRPDNVRDVIGDLKGA